MGCKPSKPMAKEEILEANRLAMEKNQQRGKQRMGHDHGIPNMPLSNHQRPVMHPVNGGASSNFLASGTALSFAI